MISGDGDDWWVLNYELNDEWWFLLFLRVMWSLINMTTNKS